MASHSYWTAAANLAAKDRVWNDQVLLGSQYLHPLTVVDREGLATSSMATVTAPSTTQLPTSAIVGEEGLNVVQPCQMHQM